MKEGDRISYRENGLKHGNGFLFRKGEQIVRKLVELFICTCCQLVKEWM